MLKIQTVQIREEIYYSLRSHEMSPKNRKDTKKEQEEQETYYTLINTTSRRAKCDEKL